MYFRSVKDNFSSQADQYAKYRPGYPPALFEFILKHVAEKNVAWDCATGNGQTARELAIYFQQVWATDISQKQLDHAVQSASIQYSVQPAEETNFPDNSIDLITVSQALHWFKFDKFYEEVNRVGKPGAVLAVWMYSLLRISPTIDKMIEEYHFDTLEEFWDKERKYVDDNYSTIPFPFKEIKTPGFSIAYYWTLAELEGYLTTWSALQKFITAKQYNPVPGLIKKIEPLWTEKRMNITFPIHLRIGTI